mgnify:FL=1
MNDIFQIRHEFDVDELREEIRQITHRCGFGSVWTQMGLQGSDPNKKGKGESQKSVGKAEGEEWEKSFKYPLFDAPVINSFMEKFNLHRTRLMIQLPKTALTYHKDWSQRIHLPIHTHPHCMMIIDTQAYYLEQHKVYYADTTKKHTAVNCHPSIKRVHIVGCLDHKNEGHGFD